MRMSTMFSQTLREAPAEAGQEGYQLLLRAGLVRQLAAGIFSHLPLGHRVMQRIAAIIREEMESIGGQELVMPVVHPADLWQRSGRWYAIDAELARFQDRTGREVVLGMTHEEVAAELASQLIRSYRQLPQVMFQIQTKFRDDPRPRGGLVRLREFTMKDSYTFDATWEGLETQYWAHYNAYLRMFQRCGVPVIAVAADMGMMGGKVSHEFMYLHPNGEDTLILCDSCGYAANRQVARARIPSAQSEEMRAIERVATPDCKTIADLARFLGVSEAQTAKAVFFIATLDQGVEQFVFAVVRGDTELNETKLANALRSRALRPATEAEIQAVGAVPGYASPVGLRDVRVVVDPLVVSSPNLVSGANEAGYHLRNVNYGRDFQAELVTELVAARAGDGCPECGTPLRAVRGVEVGNIFQLGTRYAEVFDALYLDADGQRKPVVMGSYGIGLDRLLACIVEQHHDEHGIIWPVSVAPYQVHLVRLAGRGSTTTIAEADRIYDELCAAGMEPLYDDRDESPGIKFNDADLIGIPLRLTVADRSLAAGGVELKRRDRSEKTLVPLHALVAQLQEQIAQMNDELVSPSPARGSVDYP